MEAQAAIPRDDLRGLKITERIRLLNSDNCILEGTPARIVTPEGCWAYAAEIPLSIPSGAVNQIWVRVRAVVLKGEAGFGLLNRAGTEFQDRGFAAVGPKHRTIYLEIKDATDLRSLIIQNATPDGKSAEILLEEAVYVGNDPREGTPEEPWPFAPRANHDPLLKNSFDLLRKKWNEVPATETGSVMSAELMKRTDSDLLTQWDHFHQSSVCGPAFPRRGWYELIYRDVFRGKKVLDFGCGLAITTVPYAESGAAVTFVDLVQSNVEVVRRVCRLKGLQNVRFCYMEDLGSLADLPEDFDFIYCCGSMINAPTEVIRLEAQELLKHLKVGGRWIELAYPKSRWVREGKMPFDRWGEKTDGGAPWMEWHDLEKVRSYLAPVEFEVVIELVFHNEDFNWFDLIRRT
jgi:2-polyprenyl-3-methyl-5-hydroxy-6-metoxy-1,4-benzoquinol methylase